VPGLPDDDGVDGGVVDRQVLGGAGEDLCAGVDVRPHGVVRLDGHDVEAQVEQDRGQLAGAGPQVEHPPGLLGQHEAHRVDGVARACEGIGVGGGAEGQSAAWVHPGHATQAPWRRRCREPGGTAPIGSCR
jgi:hypothetical protein